MTGDKLSKDSRARIEAMCATNDGFQLSELDLKLRGAGDIHGTQQSGDAFELNIANLATDTQIMELTRNDAIEILHSDPTLERRENVALRALRDRHHKREKIDFSDIS
jgi:ATP-dependent DNA helicase RecG